MTKRSCKQDLLKFKAFGKLFSECAHKSQALHPNLGNIRNFMEHMRSLTPVDSQALNINWEES